MTGPRDRARRSARRAAVAAVTALAVLPGLAAGCGGGDDDGGDLATGLDPAARRGQQVARDRGCAACHSADGDEGTGPTWKGLWGTTVELDGGRTATVDRAYVTRSIRDPDADLVEGYTAVMPTVEVSEGEIDAIVAYLEALRS